MHNGDVEGARQHWQKALEALKLQTSFDAKAVAEITNALQEVAKLPPPTKSVSVLAPIKARCDMDCFVCVDGRDIAPVFSISEVGPAAKLRRTLLPVVI
jgi:hypothetical protein